MAGSKSYSFGICESPADLCGHRDPHARSRKGVPRVRILNSDCGHASGAAIFGVANATFFPTASTCEAGSEEFGEA
jgi:hypothetical protein